MRILSRDEINTVKWNQLVDSTNGASFFSYSWYLDAVAENWCVAVNSDYTEGFALPFSTRLGVKTLYTPIFISYVEVLGNGDKSVYSELIKNTFKNIALSSKQKIFQNSEEYVNQEINNWADRKTNSQAKRMLKKADKNQLVCNQTEDFDFVYSIIKSELMNKFSGLDERSMKSLFQLFVNAKSENALIVFQVSEQGGIVCLKNDKQIFYLKGAVDETSKQNGGMYLALESAINMAENNSLSFDFGGSRVEGVRRFNHNMGGTDTVYYSYTKTFYPWWYRLLKSILKK